MFSTGEFSKIARVSKRLLQYYDEIDLLKPAYTDPKTGFRSYSAKQLPRLNRILALKELGLSLDQIARMLDDHVSDEEIHGMLLMQKAELEQKLVNDLQRFRRIESRLRHQADIAKDVVLKSVPEQQYLSLRSQIETLTDGWMLIQSLAGKLPKRVGKHNIGHFVAIIHGDAFSMENFEAELGYLLTNEIEPPSTIDDYSLSMRSFPAVETMATTVHIGGPSIAHLGYGALGAWIEANGYSIIGQQREVFIQLTPDIREEDVVIEIQFPVEKVISPASLLPDFLDKSE